MLALRRQLMIALAGAPPFSSESSFRSSDRSEHVGERGILRLLSLAEKRVSVTSCLLDIFIKHVLQDPEVVFEAPHVRNYYVVWNSIQFSAFIVSLKWPESETQCIPGALETNPSLSSKSRFSDWPRTEK